MITLFDDIIDNNDWTNDSYTMSKIYGPMHISEVFDDEDLVQYFMNVFRVNDYLKDPRLEPEDLIGNHYGYEYKLNKENYYIEAKPENNAIGCTFNIEFNGIGTPMIYFGDVFAFSIEHNDPFIIGDAKKYYHDVISDQLDLCGADVITYKKLHESELITNVDENIIRYFDYLLINDLEQLNNDNLLDSFVAYKIYKNGAKYLKTHSSYIFKMFPNLRSFICKNILEYNYKSLIDNDKINIVNVIRYFHYFWNNKI